VVGSIEAYLCIPALHRNGTGPHRFVRIGARGDVTDPSLDKFRWHDSVDLVLPLKATVEPGGCGLGACEELNRAG
jgi:hypothetical protein